MNLIDRAKNIIVSPKTEWEAVADEEPNIQQIITGYVIPLALIGTIASLIGYGFIGGAYWGTSINYGVAQALIVLINAILSVFIAAFVIDALAPSFGSQKNMGRAFQLIVYSMTPSWIGGVFSIYPPLVILGTLLSLYGLYLFYLGFTPLMQTPEDKKIGYIIVSIVVLIVVYIVLGIILSAIFLGIFGLSMLGSHG